MTRPPSFEQFDYRVRLRKHVERKMLVDAFHRLRSFHPLDSYRYVGLGSPFFVDFVLFHRALAFGEMVSIEKRVDRKLRVRFNRPFSCVSLRFGETNAILPVISWNKPAVVWLDYDGSFNGRMLTDVATVARFSRPGTALLVTVNATADRVQRGPPQRSRIDQLQGRLGPEWPIPIGVAEKDVTDWGYANIVRRMVADSVLTEIRARNKVVAREDRMVFKPLFNFRYEDGARMLTYGGVFHRDNQADRDAYKRCAWEDLPFIRKRDKAFEIRAPYLTLREFQLLESMLPISGPRGKRRFKSAGIGLSRAMVNEFRKLYRYYPLFAETHV